MDFWTGLDGLVEGHEWIIDRPKGSAHPRYPDFIYPLDYGYLEGTASGDGGGIDIWVGSLPAKGVTAIIVCVDAEKGDVEVKVLLGCTPEEAQLLVAIHNSGGQAGMLVERPQRRG